MPTHHKEILLLFFKIKKYKMTERSIDLRHPLGEKKMVFLYVVVG